MKARRWPATGLPRLACSSASHRVAATTIVLLPNAEVLKDPMAKVLATCRRMFHETAKPRLPPFTLFTQLVTPRGSHAGLMAILGVVTWHLVAAKRGRGWPDFFAYLLARLLVLAWFGGSALVMHFSERGSVSMHLHHLVSKPLRCCSLGCLPPSGSLKSSNKSSSPLP